MTHVLLLRHGQTAFNAGGTIQGHLPTPLNDVGHAQAASLAARLRNYEPAIDYLITSDLRRAEQTAAPIEVALGMTAVRDATWRERSFGAFEGKTIGDTEIWRAATGTIDPPGAEPLPDLDRRVGGALALIADQHRGRRCVAVVTHGGVVRTALRLFLEGRLALARGHEPFEVGPIPNASILHVAFELHESETRWRVLRINDVDHLPATGASAKDAG